MPYSWIEPTDLPIPQRLIESIGGHPLVARALYRRGYQDIDTVRGFLDPAFYKSAPPWQLPDMKAATTLLGQAISDHRLICVWGDFDVDGQTATTILVSALRRLGGNVTYHIPIRATESHGIDPLLLKEFISKGIDLLLTCDTGVAAVSALKIANQHQLPVIITDHHDLPAHLPTAQALINPKLLPINHPLSSLPGAGVALKLIEALYTQYGQLEFLSESFDLVALGIVADLACLQSETRYLLQLGLPILRQMPRLGLKFLAELAELNPQYITEEHISFILAPRMNALGRLGDANSMVEFLTTKDPIRAQSLAYELDGLNANRRLISEQVYRSALDQLNSDTSLQHYNVIVLANPSWPAGIIGIVASRLVDRYQKPVILFSSPPGKPARGSARSIAGVNISEAIATQTHLVESFGGHPSAAGMSLQPENIAEFRKNISRAIEAEVRELPSQATLTIDEFIEMNSISLDLAIDIERLAPFGIGNPPIILACRNLLLTGYSAVGKHGEHLLMTVEDELGYTQKVIWWQGTDKIIPEGKFDMAFTARSSTYRGTKDVQLEWIDWKPACSEITALTSIKTPITVIDYRYEANPNLTLERIQTDHDVQIWCETEDRIALHAHDRLDLTPCENLVIWSIPPGPDVLQQVIRYTSPKHVFLFAIKTNMDQPEVFIKRLAGLCKSAIRRDSGNIDVLKLAAATNQQPESVHVGLRWLETYGYILIKAEDIDRLRIESGISSVKNPDPSVLAELQSQLNESAAFRRYFLRADKESLNNLINYSKN